MAVNVLKIRNIADKICRANQNTHFIFNKMFTKICASCKVIWKTDVQTDRQTGHRRQYNKAHALCMLDN